MPPRPKSRVLPPLVLAVVVASVLFVISTASPGSATTEALPTTTTASTPTRRTYRVREGDDLSSVAQRYRLTLGELTGLNPRVDAQSLSIGTVLRLRR